MECMKKIDVYANGNAQYATDRQGKQINFFQETCIFRHVDFLADENRGALLYSIEGMRDAVVVGIRATET